MIKTAAQGRKALIEIQTTKKWSGRKIAEEMGVSPMCVSLIMRRKHKTMAVTTMLRIGELHTRVMKNHKQPSTRTMQ